MELLLGCGFRRANDGRRTDADIGQQDGETTRHFDAAPSVMSVMSLIFYLYLYTCVRPF
jgi:hypothetical protein